MRVTWKEALIGIVIAAFIGTMVIPALAADRQGRAKIAAVDDGRKLVWDTLATVTNSGVLEKANGITTEVIVYFTNSSSESVDIWIQHAKAEVADGGVFVNATTVAMVFDPSNSDTYSFAGNLRLSPFVRIHTEDADITSNNVTVEVVAW